MDKASFCRLAPGATVWIDPDPTHASTRATAEALRESFGDAAVVVLDQAWSLVERCGAAGSPCAHGMTARLRSADGYELLVHRSDLVAEPAATFRQRRAAMRALRETEDAARASRVRARLQLVAPSSAFNTSTTVEPPRCEGPRRAAWKDNRKIGAVYVDAEPGGTVRVSLVVAQPDGTSRCEAESRGLEPVEVERAIATFAGRLARRVAAPVTENMTMKTGEMCDD